MSLSKKSVRAACTWSWYLQLSMVLGIALMLACPCASAAPAKRVFIITSRGCEDVCKSFQHSLASHGAVDFVLRDAGGDMARVPAFVAEARKQHADLIATWGTGITLAVVGPYDAPDPADYVHDIPVVYMYVGNPVESHIVRDTRISGRPNVAGANTTVPMEEQINLLMSYRKVRRVGMVYNTNEAAAVAQAAAARAAFEARGVQVSEVKFPLDRSGTPRAADVPVAIAEIARTKPDFLYQIGSTFTLQQVVPMSSDAIALGIPMFTSLEPAFRDGEVLLGLVTSLAAIGEVSAYQAAQVLFHGKRPGDLPTPTVTGHSVLINMRASRALRLYPPMKLLQFAELTE